MLARFFAFTLLLLLIVNYSRAQSIVIDDFNASALSEAWSATGNTFSISVENSQLKVAYSRTASSGLWDQFHWLADREIRLSSYKLKLKFKTSISVKLAIKPVYKDGTSDWFEKSISSSSTLADLEYSIQSTNTKILSDIYFYFDGGTTTAKSGIAYLDDIVLELPKATAELDNLIQNAENFLSHLDTEEYWVDSVSSFTAAINQAKEVSQSEADQTAIDSATAQLKLAYSNIEASYIRPELIKDTRLTDTLATKETILLYYNLKKLSGEKILFGHQDATGYGVGWTGDNDKSDVKSVCGSYPALAGWGLRDIANGSQDQDAVYRVKKFYKLGAVNTFDWHIDNPLGGDFYWDNRTSDENPVSYILPGGSKNEDYKLQLKNIAQFFMSLKGDNGESIPVIFRPFHEHTGDWFWWGKSHCTIDEYKALWKFTVEYMRDSLNMHQVIYAYSPDQFKSMNEYLERYPGDEYIDILGFDDYWNLRDSSGKNNFINELEIVGSLATERNKICAVTETGLEGITYNAWFTERLLAPVLTNENTRKISFFMVWRNANSSHFYAPYPGHTSVADFINFYNNPVTVFVNSNLPSLYELAFPTGAADLTLSQSAIQIYPNPASSVVFLRNIQRAKVCLYRLDGVMVDTKVIIDGQYPVSHISNGFYILGVSQEDKEPIVTKILIQR